MLRKERKYYRCGCYLTNNFYIPELDKHVSYFSNEDTFLEDSKLTPDIKQKIQRDIKQEYLRRAAVEPDAVKRKHAIQKHYRPLLNELYVLKDKYLDDRFIELVEHAKEPGATISSIKHYLKTEQADEVYRFKVFTEEFCTKFLLELDHFAQSGLPTGRPNTMNHNGILLDELGFYDNFISPLREKYLNAVASVLYPNLVGSRLDSHKAFTVAYKDGEDVDLAFHYDNAEVTLNICLGKNFDDGSLYFGGMRKDSNVATPLEVRHVVGEGVLHRGQQMHGAMPISYGERVNLIIWMRSSSVRNTLCPMCDHKPDLIVSDGFGDGFRDEEPRIVEMCLLH